MHDSRDYSTKPFELWWKDLFDSTLDDLTPIQLLSSIMHHSRDYSTKPFELWWKDLFDSTLGILDVLFLRFNFVPTFGNIVVHPSMAT